jgi:hypothetical protein
MLFLARGNQRVTTSLSSPFLFLSYLIVMHNAIYLQRVVEIYLSVKIIFLSIEAITSVSFVPPPLVIVSSFSSF